jgi:cyclophilin family peptidyl-prolyl cis-trans isomerase/HEAT repeat protein
LADVAERTLVILARDRDAYVRVIATESLGSYANTASGATARRAIRTSIRDPDENVRIAAAGLLDRVLGHRSAEWRAMYSEDTTFAVRRVVVTSAVRAGLALEAIDLAGPQAWQHSREWRRRSAVADAASGASADRCVALALPLTADSDGRVRNSAYSALAACLDSTHASGHPWRSYMLSALADPDPYVRATALDALTSHATAVDAGLGVRAYLHARADTAVDARLAALHLLAAAWSHDSGGFTDSLRRQLAMLPLPGDPRELGAVGPGSVWSAWHHHLVGTDRPRPIAWYDSVVRAVVVPSLAGHRPEATIRTARGPLTVSLLGDVAPLTVANFMALARRSFYRGTAFHRVVPAFVAQDGDPRGDGNGGPGYAIRDELNRTDYEAGTVGMALAGPDTGGSQYFFALTQQPHLDGHYPVFGVLEQGLATLAEITQGDSIAGVSVQ